MLPETVRVRLGTRERPVLIVEPTRLLFAVPRILQTQHRLVDRILNADIEPRHLGIIPPDLHVQIPFQRHLHTLLQRQRAHRKFRARRHTLELK
jgi:hypothetical protein